MELKVRPDETLRIALVRRAMETGLDPQKAVDTYDRAIKQGHTEQEAATYACHAWDLWD